MVVFSGDPFVDIACEQIMMGNQLSIQLVILTDVEYW